MGSAPTAVARGTPEGIFLKDGYQTLVTIGNDATLEIWEKSVTPPGLDGGEPVETSTMHNTTYRTMGSRTLITLTPITFTAAYDPEMYDTLLAVINAETTITVTFPDGSTLAFYGYVQKVEPGELVDGTQPEVTVTVQPTNQDPTDRSEQAPVLVETSGT